MNVVSDDNPFSFFEDNLPSNEMDLFSDKSAYVAQVPFAPTLRTITPSYVIPTVFNGSLVSLSDVEATATLRGSWKIIAMNKTVLGSDGDCSLFMETRTNKTQTEDMDTDLFSSISYELRQTVTGTFTKHVPFLLTRLQVVDPTTGEEIRKDNKMILSGACESTLSPQNRTGGTFETIVKFKFTDVSYHHDKRPFALRVSIFLNSNTDEAILVKQSQPIMVFARKKQFTNPAPKTVGKKRKAEDESSTPAKARKTSTEEMKKQEKPQSDNFGEFNTKLEALFQQVAQMSTEDKSVAMKKILQRLYEANIVHVFADPSSPN